MIRKLKIEPFDPQGDYGKTAHSQIRIKGQWLTAAGFPPGASVEPTVCSPGVIELRLCAPPQLRAKDFTAMLDRLTAATKGGDQ